VFATHYHELTQLADEFSSVRNFNVDVRESGDRILFLHRLKPGGADRSYGIEVGRLAGLPQPVIARARALLKLLEGEQIVAALSGKAGIAARAPRDSGDQLGLFAGDPPHPVVERLREIDVNTLTPLEALALLAQLTAEARAEPVARGVASASARA
jgi:DNA mismatch repair protein MutS